MFTPRDTDALDAAEDQGEKPKEEEEKGEEVQNTEDEKSERTETASITNVPDGYQVIIPSPSKRMEMIRSNERKANKSSNAKTSGKPKASKPTYRNEMTGDDQEKIAEYGWPEKPAQWSTVEDSENPDEKIVNGQKVTRPIECHRVEVDGEKSEMWALNPNVRTGGRCGTGSERDTERYGELGKFEEGDFLLVPDGKRNQLFDGGWFTGESQILPKPYGRSVRLEWADTSSYRGSKIDTEAWRGVWVPVTRIIKAPVTKRTFERGSKKRGNKNKITNALVSKMTLGTEVVYKDNAPYCLFSRNPREGSVWVRSISGGEALEGGEDDLCCFYLEDLDAYSIFTTKMASQMKQLMQKLQIARQRKERRAQKEEHKTSVDPGLAHTLAAASITSSPGVSELGSRKAHSLGGLSSTPIGQRTPLALAHNSAAMQNLAPVLQAQANASPFGVYGMPRSEPFTETEFWKNEAHTFLADSKGAFQGLSKIQFEVEQVMKTLCDLSDHVRLGVTSQIELMRKNQELADRTSLTVSQLTALSQAVAKNLGARLQSTAIAKTSTQQSLPDTEAYYGKTATEILTATTPMAYRTTVVGLGGMVSSGNVCNSPKPADTNGNTTNGTEPKPSEPKTPKLRNSHSRESTPVVSKPINNGPSPESQVMLVQKSTYKPSRPKGPWSAIDRNSLFFKLDEDWISCRRAACLRLGRPIFPHEMGAVKWLGWRDAQFDPFAQLKEPEEFAKILAMVNYVEAKGNGTGLDDKVIGNFVKSYKEGKQERISIKLPTLPQTKVAGPYNKAQLKQLASPAGPAKKETHKEKDKKTDSGGTKRKRGMKKGYKRRAADPKLREVWPGVNTAANFNIASKRIWSSKHIESAKRTVANLKDRSRIKKEYRFIERLLKQMIDEKLSSEIADAADLKHACISLRNALRKLATAGWQLQEQECKKYHFYWAAMEVYKDNYPTEWPSGNQRDSAQLKVAENVAGIAKSWEVLEAEPPTKKTKTDEQPTGDVSHGNEGEKNIAAASPEAKVEIPEQIPQPTEPMLLETVDPRDEIAGDGGEIIIAPDDPTEDDFVANEALHVEPEIIDENMDEGIDNNNVDNSLLLAMQDDDDDLQAKAEEQNEQEESDDGDRSSNASTPAPYIPTEPESGEESDDEADD